MDPAVTVTGHSTGPGPVAAVPGDTRTATGAQATLRQSRVEMSKVDLWSALKISLCFYLAGLALLIVTGLVVWLLLDASGGIRDFEKFMGDILSAKDFHFVAPQILLGSVLVGLVLVALDVDPHGDRRRALQRVRGPRRRHRGHAHRDRLNRRFRRARRRARRLTSTASRGYSSVG